MQAFVSFPLILSPAGRRSGVGDREQGWPRGAERLRGVRWRRDGVLSRSTSGYAAEPSSQPRARGRARSGIFSEPLECGRVCLLLLLLLLSFGWGHSGHSCCCISALRAKEQKWRKSVGVGTRPLSAGRWRAASFRFPAPRRPWAPVSTAEALPPGLCGFCLLSQYPAPAPGPPSEETPCWSFQVSDVIVNGGSRSPLNGLASVSVLSSLSHLLMEASVCLVTFISSFLVLSPHKEAPVNPSSAPPALWERLYAWAEFDRRVCGLPRLKA